MSGVVVEVRVKEGQEIKKGDPLAGTYPCRTPDFINLCHLVMSAMKVCFQFSNFA